MTTTSDLEKAYEATLSGLAPATSPGQADDAYELYIFTLVLRAAKAEGANVWFASTSGTQNPPTLRFRTSPGRIFSTAKDYTHAVVDFHNGPIYEAHIGIFVEGAAGVLHECDVAVLEAAEASFCRSNLVHPKRRSALLTVECKFYTGRLGIALGREFLGITTDLGTEGRFMVSNSDGRSVDRVLAHHKRKRQFQLTPLDRDVEMQAIAQFRSTFRDAKAKHR